MAVNGSRSIKQRRTRSSMDTIRAAILKALAEDHTMTVRQVFYRLVSLGAIKKTDGEYLKTVIRLLTEMRRDGQIDFDSIEDNGRSMRRPQTYPDAATALRLVVERYRRSYWDDQPAYVEVWLEKDALAGVFLNVTWHWDVPLMVTRGYPSITFLHDAAMAIVEQGKPAFLYCFGDHDPSGVDITRALEKDIREFAPDADITLERIAVTEAQIESLNLLTRPTKESDARAKNWVGESVELDAIPPKMLREIVAECIGRNIDVEAWEESKRMEKADRAKLIKAIGKHA